MALGDNNNNKKNYENSYYSRIKFSNYEDKTMLSFSFWKGLLKVSLNAVKDTYNGVEYEELQYIHLSPQKALLLRKQLEVFLTMEDSCTTRASFGVDTGMTDTRNYIAFGNKEDSTEADTKRMVMIGKIDTEGKVTESAVFNFNHQYHLGIKWLSLETMECDVTFDDNLEIELFCKVLDEYISAMTGATSYSVLDMGRFDYSRINTKIGLVMNALGIETQSSRQSTGGSNSYFANKGKQQASEGAASPQNQNRARTNPSSIDDIENLA